MKTTEKVFDIQTGEEIILEREMTAEEIKKYEEAVKRQKEFADKLAAQAAAKAVLLERLGITEEEAKLLLG